MLTTRVKGHAMIGRALWFVTLALVFIAVMAACEHVMSRDDSDTPTARSGFSVYTDALTGCQYIGRPFIAGGGMLPRSGPDGKQICTQRRNP